MLRIGRVWKCEREGIYFNNIFWMFVGTLYRRKFGAVREFLCFVTALCVCVWGAWRAKAALTIFNNIQRFAID
jgi:hypothetical protein